MQNSRNTNAFLIVKLLPWLEKAGLALLAVAAMMVWMNVPANELLMIALATFATVFFLNSHTPPVIKTEHNAPVGFHTLLAHSILPKILWISASISTIGICFKHLDCRAPIICC